MRGPETPRGAFEQRESEQQQARQDIDDAFRTIEKRKTIEDQQERIRTGLDVVNKIITAIRLLKPDLFVDENGTRRSPTPEEVIRALEELGKDTNAFRVFVKHTEVDLNEAILEGGGTSPAQGGDREDQTPDAIQKLKEGPIGQLVEKVKQFIDMIRQLIESFDEDTLSFLIDFTEQGGRTNEYLRSIRFTKQMKSAIGAVPTLALFPPQEGDGSRWNTLYQTFKRREYQHIKNGGAYSIDVYLEDLLAIRGNKNGTVSVQDLVKLTSSLAPVPQTKPPKPETREKKREEETTPPASQDNKPPS